MFFMSFYVYSKNCCQYRWHWAMWHVAARPLGISAANATIRLQQYYYNKIKQKISNLCQILLLQMWCSALPAKMCHTSAFLCVCVCLLLLLLLLLLQTKTTPLQLALSPHFVHKPCNSLKLSHANVQIFAWHTYTHIHTCLSMRMYIWKYIYIHADACLSFKFDVIHRHSCSVHQTGRRLQSHHITLTPLLPFSWCYRTLQLVF